MNRLFSVTELLENIKIVISENFPIVDVTGEVSNVSLHTRSGHLYFNLIEDKNMLSCVCWKNTATNFKDVVKEGVKIHIRGRLLSYSTNSKFYVNAFYIVESGKGSLAQHFIQLKNKLLDEGLFDTLHKKPITKYPRIIGLITSKDGDVIDDITTNLNNTFPCKILFFNVPVQGLNSVDEIIIAIEYFNKLTKVIPDFLIIARGGGSDEDFYHFNEECLIRAIYKSRIPIISAIGHDSNNTLTDLVADKSVSTPTAAVAFLGDKIAVQEKMKKLYRSMYINIKQSHHSLTNEISYFNKMLKTPHNTINIYQERVQSLLILQETYIFQDLKAKAERLINISSKLELLIDIIDNYQQKLIYLKRILKSFSFQETLKRGFSITYQDNKIIKSMKELKQGEFKIEFFDGIKHIKKDIK